MAKKKSGADEVPEETRAEATPRRPASDYCVLVNLGKSPLPCPLSNGKVINLGKCAPGVDIHKSEPVLKKHRTPILFTWQKKGRLAFEEVTEGGAK